MSAGESWLRVAELVGELAELSVVDLDETMGHLLRRACEIVGAGDAVLGFAVRNPNAPADDPLNGWRPPLPYRPHRFGPHAERDGALLTSWYGSVCTHPLDEAAVAVSRGGGCIRAVMHRDVMDERAWHRAAVYDLLDASGITDRLIGGRPVGDDVDLMLVIYRRIGERPFGEEERWRLQMVLAALAGVGRRLALADGLIDARCPLTRREREALHYLLLGLPEKQIAGTMGLSERTLHHHVTAIFQKFGVQSRAELMALFLASGSMPERGGERVTRVLSLAAAARRPRAAMASAAAIVRTRNNRLARRPRRLMRPGTQSSGAAGQTRCIVPPAL